MSVFCTDSVVSLSEEKTTSNDQLDCFSGIKRNRSLITPQLLQPIKKSNLKKTVTPKKQGGPFGVLWNGSNGGITSPPAKMIKYEVWESTVPRIKIDPDIFDSSSDDDDNTDNSYQTDDDENDNYTDSSSGVSSAHGISPENCQRSKKMTSTLSTQQRQIKPPVKPLQQKILPVPQLQRNAATSKLHELSDALGQGAKQFPVGANQKVRPFCYNCKRYGHFRKECYAPWYHWWPTEYLSEYPWMRRVVRELRELRSKRRWNEYNLKAKKLEDDVERADQRKLTVTSQKPGMGKPVRYFQGPSGSKVSAMSRADGQRILQAIRRSASPPGTSPCNSQHGLPAQFTFSFECQSIIENLKRQLDELKLSLTQIKAETSKPIQLKE